MVRQAFEPELLETCDDPGGGTRRYREVLVERAKVELKARRHRHAHFPSSMFGEPAWDMLLVLYLAEAGRHETICSLVHGAGFPHATCLRWLHVLENHGFVVRKGHPTDGRVTLVELTGEGRQALDDYFSTVPAA